MAWEVEKMGMIGVVFFRTRIKFFDDFAGKNFLLNLEFLAVEN
jgi:hypothetical protein